MNEENNSISHRIIYSGWDFQQALSALTFLVEECEYEKKYSRVDLRRFRCFETTLIVAFARPFKAGRGREKLDLSAIGFEFTDDELELKDKLIRLRDKVVSHSDEEEMEYRTYSFKPFDDHDVRMPIEYFQEALYLEETDINKIERLLHRIIGTIAKYKFKVVQSNPDEFDRTKTSASNNTSHLTSRETRGGVLSEIPTELHPLADFVRARSAKIENHQKLMESDQYREQATRLKRLLKGVVEALQACWLVSTRSSALSDETLTFRFIDDTIFSLVGISSSISDGAHNPARREMRYLLESVCKHHHVDTSPWVTGKSLAEKLLALKSNVSRSSIDFVADQKFFALDEAKVKELQSDLKDMYAQSCKYVHRSKEQIDEYLAAVNRGTSPGFESVSEFKAINREFARLCDVVVFLSLAVLGPSGLAGDVFVQLFDQDNSWPYHKTKYCKALSEHYHYKTERGKK